MNVGNFLIGSVALSLVLISGTLALVSFRLLFHLERLGHTGAKEFEMTLKTMERMAEKSASDLSILQGHSAERTEASRQPPPKDGRIGPGRGFWGRGSHRGGHPQYASRREPTNGVYSSTQYLTGDSDGGRSRIYSTHWDSPQ